MQYFTGATTLGAPSKPVEIKIPLWWADGTGATTYAVSAGSAFLQDGTTTIGSSTSNQLHTLSSKWTSSTKFALEVSMQAYSTSYTAYACLWDVTSNTQVSGSQISTTSSTITVLRSGQFTLTPGHVYAVSVWSSSSSYYTTISDASLIIFP